MRWHKNGSELPKSISKPSTTGWSANAGGMFVLLLVGQQRVAVLEAVNRELERLQTIIAGKESAGTSIRTMSCALIRRFIIWKRVCKPLPLIQGSNALVEKVGRFPHCYLAQHLPINLMEMPLTLAVRGFADIWSRCACPLAEFETNGRRCLSLRKNRTFGAAGLFAFKDWNSSRTAGCRDWVRTWHPDGIGSVSGYLWKLQ